MTRTTAAHRLRVYPRRYTDSILLMRLADTLTGADGVTVANAVMATTANKTAMQEQGWAGAELVDAGPDDLVVTVAAGSVEAAEAALDRVPELLSSSIASAPSVARVRSLADALRIQPATNIASVSVPGEYAAAEAQAALGEGLNVFLFSSNVSIEDEILLKKTAAERGLLCMGPDCGTALIAGKALGFGNAVRRGPVGVIGAAGTGIQAVTTLLDRHGVGVSHAIGVGSRDLTDAVGGLTTHAALAALLDDAETRVILVVSKPPSAAQASRLRQAVADAAKPVVTCLLGDPSSDAATFADAASAAARLAGADVPATALPTLAAPSRAGTIRGLFTGGSLAYEAAVVLRAAGLDVAVTASTVVGADGGADGRHVLVDLGAAELTVGRPHPMIDPRPRHDAICAAAADPSVGVVLLDVVLGYNAHPDPAGAVAIAIDAATKGAGTAEPPTFVAAVVGTDSDPQDASAQVAKLRAAGVLVAPTTAAAAELAAAIVTGAGR
jgi:FdrA protein